MAVFRSAITSDAAYSSVPALPVRAAGSRHTRQPDLPRSACTRRLTGPPAAKPRERSVFLGHTASAPGGGERRRAYKMHHSAREVAAGDHESGRADDGPCEWDLDPGSRSR